jgi:hypothetical protein
MIFLSRPSAVADSGQFPLGTNQASIGLRGFSAAAVIAALWLGISLWLALPWAAELGGMIEIGRAHV